MCRCAWAAPSCWRLPSRHQRLLQLPMNLSLQLESEEGGFSGCQGEIWT